MIYTFRPLPTWPYEVTSQRQYGQFRSGSRRDPSTGDYSPGRPVPWSDTMFLLEREVRMLGGSDVIFGIGLTERDIRLDGTPRADARTPAHPGVEVSFDSRYGRLTYATDVFTTWKDNVRAVAKALEALRAVERWGVAKRGQQYAGFALLTAGPGKEELGRELIARYGGIREALQATHPDTGGETANERDFDAVMAVKKASAA